MKGREGGEGEGTAVTSSREGEKKKFRRGERERKDRGTAVMLRLLPKT